MEEILASIRRIIADDQEVAKAPEAEPRRAEPVIEAPEPSFEDPFEALAPEQATEEDVLDLADLPPIKPVEPAEAPKPVPSALAEPIDFDASAADISFREIEPEAEDLGDSPSVETAADFDLAEEEPASVEPLSEPPPPPPSPRPEPLSFREAPPPPPPPPPPAEDRDHLLSRATDASVSQAFNFLAHTVLTSNARTLEDLVREMLRPMLKDWLDDNLPTVVERLVRAEIERVSRGGR